MYYAIAGIRRDRNGIFKIRPIVFQIWKKMQTQMSHHEPVKFPQLSGDKAMYNEQTLNLPAL